MLLKNRSLTGAGCSLTNVKVAVCGWSRCYLHTHTKKIKAQKVYMIKALYQILTKCASDGF